MKVEQVVEAVGLEPKHFHLENLPVPVIESGLYTTLGKQLFELYRKYKITSEDQREIENLAFLLSSFTVHREIPKRSFIQKFWTNIRGS